MTQTQNTGAWVTFTYVAFGLAAVMVAIGVWAMPTNIWIKGYLSMGIAFLTGSTFTLAKTVRDEHEAARRSNRVEEARTEKLLMGLDAG